MDNKLTIKLNSNENKNPFNYRFTAGSQNIGAANEHPQDVFLEDIDSDGDNDAVIYNFQVVHMPCIIFPVQDKVFALIFILSNRFC